MRNFFLKIVSFFKFIISRLLSLIYDLIVSQPVTSYTYSRFLHRLREHHLNEMTDLLDIGIGTGTALNCIIPELPDKIQILGVDIDESYVKKCEDLFKEKGNVQILLQDFLEIESQTNKKFDVILFSSSFMLMPNKNKALEISKRLLKPNGKIFFILTLFERRKKVVEKFKPLLKYVLTIDFGEALTEKQFLEFLDKNQLKVTYKERIQRKFFPCFKVFRYFLVEAVVNE